MTATAHALIGASFATIISNPIIGVPVAFISHFIADFIPHWDAGTNHRNKSNLRLKIEATFDVLLGFALVLMLFKTQTMQNPVYMFSMVIAAQLPDWLAAPDYMFNLKVPPFSWMYKIGHETNTRMQLPWGLVTQVVTVGLLVVFALGGPQNLGTVLAANF
ncbi:MAG: hypothetical protein AAB512_03195 [Patescibacteria group bacterium]